MSSLYWDADNDVVGAVERTQLSPGDSNGSGATFVERPTRSPASRALSLLRRTGVAGFDVPTTRLEWLIAGVMAGKWLYTVYKDRSQKNQDTVMRFSDEDSPYHWLCSWIETLPPSTEHTSIFNVKFSRKVEGLVLIPGESAEFTYKGIRCWIEKVPSTNKDRDVKVMAEILSREIQLRVRTLDRSFCVDVLKEIYKMNNQVEPQVWAHTGYQWTTVRPCPKNRVAILPAGVHEALENDLRDFLTSKDWYNDTGIPYRRGYLFYGIPGSGKTSLVISLAAIFEKHVSIISLADMTDLDFTRAINSMPDNSLLLLEDIDCAFKQRAGAVTQGTTFSGLLNIMDGAATPEGRITFLTTNHRDLLDEALIRPGRIDYQLEFSHAVAGQIDELATRFNSAAKNFGRKWAPDKISMATVQERLIQKYRPSITREVS